LIKRENELNNMSFQRCLLLFGLVLSGCAGNSDAPVDTANSEQARPGLQTLWVTTSTEYDAIAFQAYQSAIRQLPQAIEDPSWNALVENTPASGVAPAVILDIDETVLDNSMFPVLYPGPFSSSNWDRWISQREATSVSGAVEFVKRAEEMGVEVFFVTNRPCRRRQEMGPNCPQEQDTIENLASLGVHADAAHMLLPGESPDWTDEKLTRRRFIAAQFRIIMLFGDDLADFVPCVRSKPKEPCRKGATAEDRAAAFQKHSAYWGTRWFMFPNPGYGSWTAFIED
jgi:5'-nucleotidase (lipoprotein e(P4) family)